MKSNNYLLDEKRTDFAPYIPYFYVVLHAAIAIRLSIAHPTPLPYTLSV